MHRLPSTSGSAAGSNAAQQPRHAPRTPPAARMSWGLLSWGLHQQLLAGSPLSRSSRRTATMARTASRSDTVTLDRPPATRTEERLNQHIREGHYETKLVHQQARKTDSEQPPLATLLPAADITGVADVAVVGCGPAGLFLAAELAKRGLHTVLIGHDLPFVNNYGVWMDEFKELGLESTIECSWEDALCYFGEGPSGEVRVGRGYGRVSRRRLRQHLVELCIAAGVTFLPDGVQDLNVAPSGQVTQVGTAAHGTLQARLVTLAAGAAGGRFLKYEEGAPVVAAQTAYGIEADVKGFDKAYNPNLMTFMDFRRHHTGLWDGIAPNLQSNTTHPNAAGGLWGSANEPPSFLYAMPLGGNRVFLEETCLVAKPAVPFAVLKRRLERRMKAMGVKVTEIHEEEWSYIPVGGPLPVQSQPITAFGAAANLIHPATGFSVSRSLREAPHVADEIAAALKEERDVAAVSTRVWQKLWPQEKRTQASFHVFGMELLASMDLAATVSFFGTFFALPSFYWRGFLGSTLSAAQLLAFAMITFVLAPVEIKLRLVSHLITDPAGTYLLRAYRAQLSEWRRNATGGAVDETPSSVTIAAVVGLSGVLQKTLESACNGPTSL